MRLRVYDYLSLTFIEFTSSLGADPWEALNHCRPALTSET